MSENLIDEYYMRESLSEKFLYMQYPKVLLYGKYYKGKLKSAERELYMLLVDRIRLSISNNWFDAEDRAYCIYSNRELCEVLGVSEPTLIKFKKTLATLNLVEEKSLKDESNRIYVKMLKIAEDDLEYLRNTELDGENSETSESLETAGDLKKSSQATKENLSTSRKEFKTSKKEFLSKDIVTYKTQEDMKKEQNELLLKNFEHITSRSGLSDEALRRIGIFSESVEEAHKTVGIILRAKKSAEDKYQQMIPLENEFLQQDLEITLLTIYRKFKINESIQSKENYMYKAWENFFENIQKQIWLNKSTEGMKGISFKPDIRSG